MNRYGDNFPMFLAPGRLEEETKSLKSLSRKERMSFSRRLLGGLEELATSDGQSFNAKSEREMDAVDGMREEI